jgi:Fe-S-cluster-containing hydrogenase component 2
MDRKGHIEMTTRPTCDFCKDEDMPQCVEFCPTGAIKLKSQIRRGLENIKEST